MSSVKGQGSSLSWTNTNRYSFSSAYFGFLRNANWIMSFILSLGIRSISSYFTAFPQHDKLGFPDALSPSLVVEKILGYLLSIQHVDHSYLRVSVGYRVAFPLFRITRFLELSSNGGVQEYIQNTLIWSVLFGR